MGKIFIFDNVSGIEFYGPWKLAVMADCEPVAYGPAHSAKKSPVKSPPVQVTGGNGAHGPYCTWRKKQTPEQKRKREAVYCGLLKGHKGGHEYVRGVAGLKEV